MELQEFHYYQEKIQSIAVQFFVLSKTTTTNPKNHATNYFPIKNYAILFQVRSGLQQNQTQLGSTKPNKSLKIKKTLVFFHVVLLWDKKVEDKKYFYSIKKKIYEDKKCRSYKLTHKVCSKNI